MQSRLLIPLLALAISLAPAARAAQFTPLTDPENSVLQAVARQLIVGTSTSSFIGETEIVLVFVQNTGPVPSVIDSVFFDASQSDVLQAISLVEPIGNIFFREQQPTEDLPGAKGLRPAFVSTFEIKAQPPVSTNGINNNPAPGGLSDTEEILFLDAGLNPFTPGQLPAALSGTNGKPLRVGIHVSSIAGYKDGGSATFISNNFSPPPVPEPATWHAMLAGLGLMFAWARRIVGHPTSGSAAHHYILDGRPAGNFVRVGEIDEVHGASSLP